MSKTVKARIGDTIKDTADAYHLPVPGEFHPVEGSFVGTCHGMEIPRKVFKQEVFTKDVFREMGHCPFCHIVLSDSVMESVRAPESGEQMWLDKICVNRNKKWDFCVELRGSSRLACQVQVTKEMDGSTVFVGLNGVGLWAGSRSRSVVYLCVCWHHVLHFCMV